MASGAPFDLGIVTSGAIAGLIKQGKVAAGTQKPVARFGVGMMVATGLESPARSPPRCRATSPSTAASALRRRTPPAQRRSQISSRRPKRRRC
jgi:hypothetical protein